MSKARKSNKPQNTPQAKTTAVNIRRQKYSWLVQFIVPLAALLILGFRYGDYLYKIESLSLFISTASYFNDCMSVPGGLVTWLSSFLTQFFYYPWLGAAIYAVLLAVLGCVIVRAFSVGGPYRLYTQLVLVIVFMGLTSLNYLIFTLRPAGFAFSLLVGTLLSVMLVWVYRCLSLWWLRSILVLVVVTLGYHYLGYYALSSAVICMGISVADRKWMQCIPAVLALTGVILLPQLWFSHIGGHLLPSQIYLTGLPIFYSNEILMWCIYIGVSVILLIFSLAPIADVPLLKKIISKPFLPSTLLSLCIVGLLCQSYSDPNFRTTLALDRALWQQDWNKALVIAENLPDNPTRLNTVLADIALMRNGMAADRMFGINYGWEPYKTTRDSRTIHEAGGALISYHLGLLNYAYRWGMEYSIAQNMSVERLKMLTKCALLNYEIPLAKTYLDILYNTPFHRAWAKKYMRMANNPMEILQDPEMSTINQLMCHPNEFVNDNGAFENYVWPLIAKEDARTPQFNDLSMQAALITRDLDAFMAKFPTYALNTQRIPRYYQEAALLWSLLNNQPAPVDIDPVINSHHSQFLNRFRSTTSMDAEEQRELMRNEFGDTYWYYFVFTQDKQTI